MAGGEEREGNAQGSCPGSECPATFPRAAETHERAHQQAVSALEHDRRGGDGNSHQWLSREAGGMGQGEREFGHATTLGSGDELRLVAGKAGKNTGDE